MNTKINEYHPYGACLMYKQCRDSVTVRASIDQILSKGEMDQKARQVCQTPDSDKIEEDLKAAKHLIKFQNNLAVEENRILQQWKDFFLGQLEGFKKEVAIINEKIAEFQKTHDESAQYKKIAIALSKDLIEAQRALGALYSHNEATRQSVLLHYGRIHSMGNLNDLNKLINTNEKQ